MIGTNEIQMNGATMIAAVQCYFNTIFAEGKVPEVESVTSGNSGYSTEFIVKVKEREVSK